MGIRHLAAAAAGLVVAVASYASAHGPDQPGHQIADLGSFVLEGGASIENLRMSYVTHGTLNTRKDNAILFIHGMGANHHGGDQFVGPGMPFDSDKYFIIATDAFGNTQVGFEHSTSATNSGMKMDFPDYNYRDAINAEYKLLTEGLGIDHLLAVAGISMGAEKTVHIAVNYPDFMDGAIPIVGGALWSSEGFFTSMNVRKVIENCAGWQGGNYDENPGECAAAALGTFVPSFYTRDWWNENITTFAAYENWQKGWNDYYLGLQDARDLYLLMRASGQTTVAKAPGFGGDLTAALGAIKAKTMFIINPQDQFLPPQFFEIQNEAIADSKIVTIDSSAGHLICCGGDPKATEAMGSAIADFLDDLTKQRLSTRN